MKDTPSKKSLLFRNQKFLILNYVLIWSISFSLNGPGTMSRHVMKLFIVK